ncbi:Hypothetical predicted protein [Olea europaea subsp. europaea]|uniref:Uncharacterized protein n=1 Tax=Olea europaea subsp. europaea TaxID=158383 RepID=A0A8S0R195_OLEEU|nr:Hypothetical predicted protein [Olea europaea subsp. europaea]
MGRSYADAVDWRTRLLKGSRQMSVIKIFIYRESCRIGNMPFLDYENVSHAKSIGKFKIKIREF